MDANLKPIVAVLARLDDAELRALADTTYRVPQIAPGLLAWLDSACEWELNRAGLEYMLLPPEAAIDPSEDDVSINAAMAMRATLTQDSGAVLKLFNALVTLRTGPIAGSPSLVRDGDDADLVEG